MERALEAVDCKVNLSIIIPCEPQSHSGILVLISHHSSLRISENPLPSAAQEVSLLSPGLDLSPVRLESSPSSFQLVPPHTGRSLYQDASRQDLGLAQTPYVVSAILHNSDVKLKRWKWKGVNKGSQNISVRSDIQHYWGWRWFCLRWQANQCHVQASPWNM